MKTFNSTVGGREANSSATDFDLPKRPRAAAKTFLTVKDVAARWQTSKRHVERFIESGELKVYRFGRSVRIALDDVLLFELRRRGGGM